MSKPELGSLLGIIAGISLGMLCVDYFEIEPWFDRICLIGSIVILSQLLGATIAAALGKPHEID